MSSPITVAFAGPADLKFQAAEALLNDWLGYGAPDADGYYDPTERDVTMILAVGEGLDGDGLGVIVDWSSRADLPLTIVSASTSEADVYSDEYSDVVITKDVAARTVELLQEAGNGVLVLLWGDDPGEEAEHLLEVALDAGVSVKDLTNGLDDLIFDEEPTPEPEPEPAPKPSRGRGKAKVAEPLVPEVEALDDAPEPEEPVVLALGPGKPAGALAAKETPLDWSHGEPPVAPGEPEWFQEAYEALREATQYLIEDDINGEVGALYQRRPITTLVDTGYLNLYHYRISGGRTYLDPALITKVLAQAYTLLAGEDAVAAQGQLAKSRTDRLITKKVEAAALAIATSPQEPEGDEAQAEYHPAPVEEANEAPSRPIRGRPRKDGSPAQPRTTISVILEEDGTYSKRGRGRPRAGQEVVEIPIAEYKELFADEEA